MVVSLIQSSVSNEDLYSCQHCHMKKGRLFVAQTTRVYLSSDQKIPATTTQLVHSRHAIQHWPIVRALSAANCYNNRVSQLHTIMNACIQTPKNK